MGEPGGGRQWGAVAAGWLLLAVVATVWLTVDRRPPEWDHANHLERAVLCTQDLRAGDWRAIFERSSFYPPLAMCVAGAAGLVLPADVAATVALLGFLAVGMAAVYLLGRLAAAGRTGVAAALLFGSAPFVVYSTLHFQLDLPLAAMVALALVTLLATDDFRRPGVSVALGIVCGLGMLTKPTFVLYVAPPAVLLLVRGGRRAMRGVMLATVVAAALSLPWFGPRLLGLGAQVDARAFSQAAETHPDVLSGDALTFYPRLLGQQIGFATVVLLVLGAVVAVLRRQWFLLIAAFAPVVVLELIRNKNLRYSLPLIGGLAVIAALGLEALPGRLRRAVALVLVLVGLVQVSAVATGVPPNVLVPGLRTWWVPQSPPSKADWRHRDILTLLERDRGGARVTVSVVPNHALFSVSNFRYYAVRDGLDMRFVRAWDDPPLGIDYMILKTGEIGPPWTAPKIRRVTERLSTDADLARVFPVIGEFPLPDGSTATVRARRIPPVTDRTAAALAAGVEAGLKRRLGEVARDVEGLRLSLVYDDGILSGRIPRAEFHAAAATLGEFARPGTAHLRVHDVRIVLEDLVVNPWPARDADFQPLDLGRLRLESVAVTVGDLQRFLADLKHFRRSTVAADGDALRVTIRQAGPDVSARVRFSAATDRPFAITAEHVWVGWLPVPGLLVNWVLRNFDPAPRIASRLPFPVRIGRVTVRDEALRISAAP
jgi:Dolichyl-phosphate-mannose-protein mannosyltransferase/LmeA-like phospholipid-binding